MTSAPPLSLSLQSTFSHTMGGPACSQWHVVEKCQKMPKNRMHQAVQLFAEGAEK